MRWVRFAYRGENAFGTIEGDTIARFDGDLFGEHTATGEYIALETVALLPPTVPTKFIGLWNNFNALREKLGLTVPAEPLWFLKANSSLLGSGGTIRKPASFDGKVVFEGELGIVIGRRCKDVGEIGAAEAIFGYTCVNDVTAFEVLERDPSFAQWSRAKSYDTFGPVGPVIATELDPQRLVVRTTLDGVERQNYPCSDMTFPPARLVAALSRDMTLFPGDVIACGTSIGAGSMKPGSTVEIAIEGIGTLANRFEGS